MNIKRLQLLGALLAAGTACPAKADVFDMMREMHQSMRQIEQNMANMMQSFDWTDETDEIKPKRDQMTISYDDKSADKIIVTITGFKSDSIETEADPKGKYLTLTAPNTVIRFKVRENDEDRYLIIRLSYSTQQKSEKKSKESRYYAAGSSAMDYSMSHELESDILLTKAAIEYDPETSTLTISIPTLADNKKGDDKISIPVIIKQL